MTVSPAELDALRAQIATLRETVETLQRQLVNEHETVDMTMRNQLRCRACRCRRIAHAKQVLDRADSDARKKLALYQPSWWSSRTKGEFEAYVCTRCGLVEWWVKEPETLEPHEDFLEILDGEVGSSGAPYR